MRSSFFKTEASEPVNLVFLIDLDDTITTPERHPDGNYNIQPNGHIHATVISHEKFKSFVLAAIKTNIPLHIITARPDSAQSRALIEQVINDAQGFHTGPGGFNKYHYASFAGELVQHNETLVWQEKCTKIELINSLHRSQYPYLNHENIIFIDDMPKYLAPAKEAGYTTIQADPKTLTHFDQAMELMHTNHTAKISRPQ
jgi:hypothetical protein